MTGVTRSCGCAEVWELSGNTDERSAKMRLLKRSVCDECKAIEQLRDAWKREAA